MFLFLRTLRYNKLKVFIVRMIKTADTELITVGALLKELKAFGEGCSEYAVNIDIPDGSTLNVMGTGLDKDGEVSIEVDENPDEGYYDVQMLIDELEGYDRDSRVYLEGCGLYLTFDVNPDGHLVSGADSGEETVGFDTHAFGEYRYEPSGWLTEAEKRKLAEEDRKKKRTAHIEYIVLALLTAVVFFGLCYNVYALVVHSTRHAVWEHVLGIVACAIVLVVCGGTLYYSREK